MRKENKRVEKREWTLTSMTGVGHARVNYPQFNIEIILKSLNSKGLDLKVRTSKELQFLESDIAQELSKSIARGRIEAMISLEVFESSPNISFDATVADQIISILQDFSKKRSEISGTITMGELLKAEHLWRVETHKLDEESLRAAINAGIKEALKDFQVMRKREGALLSRPLKESIQLCQSLVESINNQSEEAVKKRFRNIAERIDTLFSSLEIEKDRIYQECALLVERSDFKEEIDRLYAHLEHFSKICQEEGLKGRKLDFLCQEMLRESSTLLTKASEHDVMTKAIDLKAEIERIREQVQNIE